ncbi:HAUS augmin-like complex subunit 3 isoform X1 [Ahaetulla prasina]|uniref:HAUS augmin-like complex subunit 3 isoform X1 n=1 Tax=Ahaetulla prasina TaxID=499056 RepID=UPI002648CF79|nr:HAUS augmin-like complex subunit 3 isoform X1 [Ahaetulla prasina]XP_058023153.1 HAUS augmin-like complex subunit 3 isoform X1 [Ahaetulla prasina]
MFTRRRSRAFLEEDIDRGTEFVEVLKTIYPKATTLDAKDFDWLFDCPETEHFLEWFCNTVGEENVLTTTELEDYEKLVTSGKPILEGEALEEVLSTCNQFFQLNSELQENEAPPIELLEQEMQMLKKQCACKKMRYNKLQICVASLKQKRCRLADEKERLNRELKKMHLKLELENFQSNNIISEVYQITEKLVHWHEDPEYEQLTLSRDLGHYLETEENFTKAFLRLFPNVVTSISSDMEIDQTTLEKKGQRDITEQRISESTAQQLQLDDKSLVCVENPDNHKTTLEALKDQILDQEHLPSKNKPEFKQIDLLQKSDQLKADYLKTEGLPVQDFSQKGLKTQTEIGQRKHLKNMEGYREELGHMELTYMWSKTNTVMTIARIKGISSALQWAEKVFKVTKENKMKEAKSELSFRVTRCQEQLCILQNEVDRNTQLLMPLLQGIARLFRLPIINGELHSEDMELEYLEGVQEEAIDQLLGQLSRFEVMRLLLMLKTKNLQRTGTKMEGLMTVLKESQSKSEEWQSCFEDSRFSIKQCPRILIDQSDLTTLRLWEMLDKHHPEKQLFRSYETLASRGSRLCQELKMLQVQLATPFPQFLKLESQKKALYCLMYGDSNQLMLHAQELSEPLEQLNITQTKIYQILMDTQTDLKAKRKALQSHLQKTERNLYIYFFSNPDLLKKTVEKVEKQTQVSS